MENFEESKNTKKDNEQQEIITEVAKSMDKEIFFTAATARKKSNAVHQKRLEVEMLPIYQKINDAINAGEYYIEMQLNAEEKSFLYDKNFSVTIMENIRSGVYKCRIKW
jgi:hypothetical protein